MLRMTSDVSTCCCLTLPTTGCVHRKPHWFVAWGPVGIVQISGKADSEEAERAERGFKDENEDRSGRVSLQVRSSSSSSSPVSFLVRSSSLFSILDLTLTPRLSNTSQNVVQHSPHSLIMPSPSIRSYSIADGICYLTLTDKTFPKKLAFAYLTEIQQGFVAELQRSVATPHPPLSIVSRAVHHRDSMAVLGISLRTKFQSLLTYCYVLLAHPTPVVILVWSEWQ